METTTTTEYPTMMTIPTLFTLSRIAVIPFLVLAFYLPVHWNHYLSALIFAAAACTDWLDGYLARTLSQSTLLGAFLDPVADKLIVAIALVILVAQTFLKLLNA